MELEVQIVKKQLVEARAWRKELTRQKRRLLKAQRRVANQAEPRGRRLAMVDQWALDSTIAHQRNTLRFLGLVRAFALGKPRHLVEAEADPQFAVYLERRVRQQCWEADQPLSPEARKAHDTWFGGLSRLEQAEQLLLQERLTDDAVKLFTLWYNLPESAFVEGDNGELEALSEALLQLDGHSEEGARDFRDRVLQTLHEQHRFWTARRERRAPAQAAAAVQRQLAREQARVDHRRRRAAKAEASTAVVA